MRPAKTGATTKNAVPIAMLDATDCSNWRSSVTNEIATTPPNASATPA